MTGKDYLLAVLLGGAYILLFGYLVGHTSTWGDPSIWSDFWGRSNAAAVSWMQLLHSAGVVLAALPIAGVFVWRYRSHWFPPASIAAIVAGFCMLLAQIRAIWLLVDIGVQPKSYYLLSAGVDTTKVGVLLLLVAALLRRLMQPRKGSTA